MLRVHSLALLPRGIRAAVLALALVAIVRPGCAASGGPDRYGYVWRDSAEPSVTYAWEDIATTGTDVTRAEDDGNTGFLALSFAFPYRGVTYSQVAACTNGWASLVDAGSAAYANGRLPLSGESTGTLAAFWDDFRFDGGGRMLFQDFGDHAVITWENAPYFDDPTLAATFQLVLFADGRILSQIAATTGPLGSATIGIESVDETDGLTAWANGPIPPPPYAVLFVPPAPIPNQLDCAGAVPLSCGDVVEADLASGASSQELYRCTPDLLSGREQIYVVDLAMPTTVRYVFEPLGGSPRLLVLPDCDPDACNVPPPGPLTLTGATGRFYFVVDSPPGGEGRYRLRAECLPLDTALDCAAPPVVGCGQVVTGDLAAGTAGQDAYWCSLSDYSGREQVWLVDFPVRVPSATLTLTTLGGDPDMLVLWPCDSNACLAPPGDVVTIPDAVGPYYVVIDCAPGAEGAYELAVTGGASPGRNVGGALRAMDHAVDTVSFAWPTAPAPRVGEEYAVLRADDDPRSPFELRAVTPARAWTDPAATAQFVPTHVWFYSIHLVDACGNLSAD